MNKLKIYSTLSDWETAKGGGNLEYPSVGLIEEDSSVVYMTPRIHALPIKAVFYDSATGKFVKLYPDEITEAIHTYTPIGVEVVPAEHDVYGTGQAGIMSLAEMNRSTPDVGSSSHISMRWGDNVTENSIPRYNYVNLVDGTTYSSGYLPSDKLTGSTSLDGVSRYYNTSYKSPSPYNVDGSRNETYYTTAYSTANALSDFDGVGNTKMYTDLATTLPSWKTDSIIPNANSAGHYPAACCCWRFHTPGTSQGQWYFPACGEMGYVMNRIKAINTTINKILSVYSSVVAVAMHTSDIYWSSSKYSTGSARCLNTKNGRVYSGSKDYEYYVRAFLRV